MKEVTKNRGLLLACIIGLVAYSVMPAVSLYVPAAVRVLLLLLTAFLLITDGGADRFFKNMSRLVPVYIIALMDLVYLVFTAPGQLLLSLYDIGSLFMVSLTFLHIFYGDKHYFSKRLIWVVIAIYAITAITTIYGNSVYPEASRRLATGMSGELEEYNIYRSMNIGGFGFVYEIVLPTVMLPFVFKEKRIPRLLSILLYLLVLYCVYATQYTLALMIVLAFGVFFFMGKIRRMSDFVIYGVSFGIVLILALPIALKFLSTFLDSDIMSQRFSDMASVLSGGSTSSGAGGVSDYDERQSAYRMSIDAFLSNPIFGTGKNGGGHAFFLDKLAKYGLLGLVALVIMLRKIFRLYIKPYKNTTFYGYLLLAFTFYLFMIVVNSSPLYMSVSFLLPLIAFALEKQVK